ncbi:hypothetical protein ACN6QF_07465, partial [Acinetobacter baumannii]
MKLQPTISKTIFYSFLFAIGGSPTLAMLIIYGQNYNPDFFMTAFMSLSILIACVLIPVAVSYTHLTLPTTNLGCRSR